jgi:RimJ/RimL family protein N-acetyltransferase
MDQNIHLVSERLIMRPIQLTDSALIFAYRSNSVINQYQGWIPKTINQVNEFITKLTSPEINVFGTWFQFVIVKKNDPEIIGDIGVHFLDQGGYQAELGITLDEHHQGMGFATEALHEVINFLFNHLNKHRITASIDPRNLKSIQLFERLGFRKEAYFKQSIFINGEWADDLIYAVLKDEWSQPCQVSKT